jgi:hypothetical protein
MVAAMDNGVNRGISDYGVGIFLTWPEGKKRSCRGGEEEQRSIKAPEKAVHGRFSGALIKPCHKGRLVLLYNDCSFFTYFNAAFAAHALLGIDGNGFLVLHLKYLYRTYINALFTANAFFLINDRIKSHFFKASIKI